MRCLTRENSLKRTLNYRNAIGKEPSNGEAYYRLGLSELKQNKAAEAFQHLNEAVRLMPQNRAAKSELEKLALVILLGRSPAA